MFAHFGGLILTIVAPAVIYAMYKDRGPFVRQQAAEALNFQLTFMLAWVAGILVSIVGSVFTFGIGLLFAFPVLIAVWIFAIVMMIIAGTAANRGEQYRYPITFRFFS